MTTILQTFLEARDPKHEYDEQRHKKTGVLEKLVLTLKGHESGEMSRLANRWAKLDETVKRLAKARDELNGSLRARVIGYFNPEDEVVQRIVKTASWNLALDKRSPPKAGDPVYDWQKIAEALAELIDDELQPKVDEIIKMYETIPEPKQRPETLRRSMNEGLMTDIVAMIGAKASKLLNALKSKMPAWIKRFDRKFAKLEALAR